MPAAKNNKEKTGGSSFDIEDVELRKLRRNLEEIWDTHLSEEGVTSPNPTLPPVDDSFQFAPLTSGAVTHRCSTGSG